MASFVNQVFISFNRPDEETVIKEIDGVKLTKIQMSNVTMTFEEFDVMTDDIMLKDLTVVHDDESQDIYYREVVLFETVEGNRCVKN